MSSENEVNDDKVRAEFVVMGSVACCPPFVSVKYQPVWLTLFLHDVHFVSSRPDLVLRLVVWQSHFANKRIKSVNLQRMLSIKLS